MEKSTPRKKVKPNGDSRPGRVAQPVEEGTAKAQLRALIEQAKITQMQAAALIEEEVKIKVAYRTMKSWLQADGTKGARTCPEWVPFNLDKVLRRRRMIP